MLFTVIFQLSLFHGCLCDHVSSGHKDVTNSEFMMNIFSGYSVNVLPVLNSDKPVLIGLYLHHLYINDIDMKSKIVRARLVFGIRWTDEYLKWNSSEFKNISMFPIQASSIWLPDLFIGNSEELLTFIKAENIQEVFLNENGVVDAWPYLKTEVGVDLDIYKYPFDTQICDFEFGSWMHSNSKIDIKERRSNIDSIDPSQLSRQSGEWDIIKVESHRLIKTYDNYVRNFTRIQYRVTLKRKWQYTILNLIAPVVLTSLLNPLSFLLPAESGERISLSNTVFLTLAVFFSIVNDSLPKTSERIPVIVAYIGLQMLGSALTIVFTIFSLALYHSNRNIKQSRILTKLFCKKRCDNYKTYEEDCSSGMEKEMNNTKDNGNKEFWIKDRRLTEDMDTLSEEETKESNDDRRTETIAS